MSAGKVLLIAAVGVGAAALLMHSAKASSSSGNQWPSGWTPPPDSDTQTIPAGIGNPTSLTLVVTRWRQTADASGRQPGQWILLQNKANPLGDWVVFFAGATPGNFGPSSPLGIVQSSGSQNAGLMAQAVAAGLIE